MKPTKSDGILAVALLLAALVGLGGLHIYQSQAGGLLVAVITVDGEEYARLPLDTDTTITLPTEHIVTVADGEVSVVFAPCPTQRCVKMSPAHTVGGYIACTPMQMTIVITEDTPA